MEIGDHFLFEDVDSGASAFNCQLYGALRQVPFIRVDGAWCPVHERSGASDPGSERGIRGAPLPGKKDPPQRAVSRILFAFAALRPLRRNDHSSRPVIADGLEQPTRRHRTGRPVPRRVPRAGASLFGLAPCGVLPAICLTADAVRSYRTFSPLPLPLRLRVGPVICDRRTLPELLESERRAVCFLCHCPSGCPDRELPGALPCGVRTFLPAFTLGLSASSSGAAIVCPAVAE